MGDEIKHMRRDISNIRRKVEVIDELKAGQARLEGLMEEMKWLARGIQAKARRQQGGKPKTHKPPPALRSNGNRFRENILVD